MQHLHCALVRDLPAAAASVVLVLVNAVSTVASAAPDPGPVVKVNQVAYVPGLPKQATVVSSSSSPLAWTLRNSAGATVATGLTTTRGLDSRSGDNVHMVDFSSFDTVGAGYVLSVAGVNSFAFDISADAIKKLRYDALAFFYHQRSGIPILSQYVGSQYARPAGHLSVAPNRGDNAVPCRVACGYTLDVRGGWYDAGDHGKYVVNGGISAWQLINEYERSIHVVGADATALGDGKLAIPERANGVPDILDEARWQVEFLLKMQVPDGFTGAGMVHHKIHDQNWTALPTRPDTDGQARFLAPISTAATLNLAAVAAQAARVWRNIDTAFSDRALTAAQKAYAAAKANPIRLASATDTTGGGPYSDDNVSDEFYWAAAELFVTTGNATYRNDLTGSPLFRGAGFTESGYDWGWTAGLGDTTLAIVPNGLPASDVAAIRAAFVSFADRLLSLAGSQGYPAPTSGYFWGSNGTIANNAIVLALAHDFSGQQKYRAGVYQALDYLFGRNPYNLSYVSGYGERAVRNMHHRFWANQLNASMPNPPPGVLAGGPNTGLEDPIAQAQLVGCSPQKCYLDDIGAWSLNEVTINWNAPLAWIANWAAEKSGNGTVPSDDPPTRPGTPVISGITASSAALAWAASSDDRGVAGYDVLRIQGTVQTMLATATSASAALTGLTASTDYTVAIRARDSSGQLSALSPSVMFRTSAATIDNPPTAPGTPIASAITPSGATLAWSASTDDRSVAGYDVLRIQGSTQSVLTTATTASAALVGLAANTDYTVAIRARDSIGQLSAPSPSVTFRTLNATTGGSCRVAYTANSWNNGFTASVTLTNTGTAAWTGWILRFNFANGQRITGNWDSVLQPSADGITVTNASWNANVAPGGSVVFGFQGTHNGTNTNPTAFTVNGMGCT